MGGSSFLTVYRSRLYSPSVVNSFIKKVKKNFPELKNVNFSYYWSGLIDVTKDLVPIVDYDPKNKSIQYVMGCAGLNWAAYCGDYAARRVVDGNRVEDLKKFLGSERKFYLGHIFQKIF